MRRVDGEQFSRKWSPAIKDMGFTMFPNVLLDVASDIGLTSSQIVVILILERHRWELGQKVYPSHETIARQSGQSARTVARCMEALSKDGYVHIIERKGMANFYDISPLIHFLDEIARSERERRRSHSGRRHVRQNVIPSRHNLSYDKDSFKESYKDIWGSS